MGRKLSFMRSNTVTTVATAPDGDNSTLIANTAFVTNAIKTKAPLDSPSFTGTPKATTADAGTSTTQLATTEFVTKADNLKAPVDSPSFTGTPKAPTADAGTKTTQIATTEFVTIANNNIQSQLDKKAPLDSPALTGTPTGPTASAGTKTTQLATTEFVTNADNLKANIASPSFTGQVFIPEGTNSAPGLVFQNDDSADTGLYHISNGNFGATCNGTEVVAFTPSGANLLGTPTAPTADAGTKTTQIATTEFVTNADNLKAPLDSPSFTGTPKAPTADAGTSTTQLATTEFVTKADNLKAPLASPSFTGQVFIPEGTASAPGLVFQNDDSANTGLYHISDGVFGATCNTVPVMSFSPTGANLLKTPLAPTAASGTNTTQIATTSFVIGEKGGRRNYLINGNFDKWDYGTSQDPTGYGSDNRWRNSNNGSTKTASQQTCGDTERALFNAMFYSRTKVTSSSGSGNYVVKQQAIENVNLMANKTITLSFWAKADASKNIAMCFDQYFGTGGSPSSTVTGIGAQQITLTTSWQKKSITVNIPSIVGKTLGSDGVQTTATVLNFWFDAGSDLNSRTASLGQQSGTFDIAQVKIEDGSVATNGWFPYDGEFGDEISACARYLNKFTGLHGDFGGYTQGAYATCYVNYTPMRVVPSITSSLANVSYGNAEKLKMDVPTVNTARILWDATAASTDVWFAMGSGDYFMLSAEL
jgi:hypothetical protein